MADFKRLSFDQASLFPLATRFRIIEIGARASLRGSDDAQTLKALVVACEDMYPSIGRWFMEKVIPGLRTGERVAYVAYENEKAVASAILKLGNRSKFCHLRIHRDFQDQDLGRMFFTQMALEARRCAKEIHFTLPESLWCTKRRFFESFGFTSPVKAFRQYRASDGALACSAPQSVVWQAALEGLPALMCKFAPGGFSLGNRILISVQPKYAECIIGGKKSVEIRKRFSRRWLGCRAVLYASHPVSALVAEATISGIASGAPDEIWSEYGSRVGAELEEFEAYTAGCNEVNAIELTDVAKYIAPVSTSELSYLTRADLRPPQSFCDLHPERCNPWTAAVAVATLLHGRFDYLPGS